jgi:hopene-associated glycosyltransferase HpnB
MSKFVFIASVVALGAWTGLVLARGRYWDARIEEPVADSTSDSSLPSVAVVIPARNEADVIGEALASLAVEPYRGPVTITVVDDRSTDGTGAIARAAGADVVVAEERPAGWAGKVWAMDQGVRSVLATETPEYWLFTDADIAHQPNEIAALVSEARRGNRDLVSLMVNLRCETPWEKLLIPAFVYFFRMLYPFAWVADPERRTAGAAGGIMLVRADALARIGGMSAISGALIDDCSLAKALKNSGARLRLSQSLKSRSIRPYVGLAPLWNMVARSAFTQLRYSYVVLAGTVVGLALLYLLPPVLFGIGVGRRDVRTLSLAGAACVLMFGAYAPTLKTYNRSYVEALVAPFVAVLYGAMTVDSGLRHLGGTGGAWKGRTY